MIRKVAIIDYGINNISSVEKAFKKIEVGTERVRSKEELKKFKHLVLTGVGSFDWGIKNLKSQGLYEEIRNLSKKGHFIMGICLGMQLLLNESDESEKNVKGLGVIEGRCVDISTKIEDNIPVPHMGWSEVSILNKNNKLTKDIDAFNEGVFATDARMKEFEEARRFFKNYGK